MQPLQDDFRDPAAKDNSITNAATARSNFDAAIAIGSAETELQNTIELRATASEIVAPTPEQKKLILTCIGNSSTSTTCNPIYSEGTILQLQITMEFHRQLIHQHHLQSHLLAGTILQLQITMEFCRPQMHETQVKPHLQCGTDPNMIRE